jgi:hypothetical protein
MSDISFINYYVDISGVPKQDKHGNYQKVIVACASVNQFTLPEIIERMKTEFPEYWNKKGHQLNDIELEQLISFINKEKIRMITVQFDKLDWEKYKIKYSSEAHIEEKIMSILYYYVLKKKSNKTSIYKTIIDFDTSFNIKESIIILQRTARERGYKFMTSFGYLEINEEIKLPDWIASARKKIDDITLNKYEHFLTLKNDLPYYNINRAFKKLS